ncbi:hypothetical protein AAG906_010311 [Vitis piasezkii]
MWWWKSECDGVEVVRNPNRPIGTWIHYYNNQLTMIKENDRRVKINDDVRMKIWVIQNEIRDCVDENEMTMEEENEEDEKFEIHPNKDVIKRVDGGSLMEMDKTFQQLKTHNKKGNEHYVDTLSIDKLCTKDMNEKNEDVCVTSIEMHIIPDENVDILPLLIKRARKDYGKEPLRALCGIPEYVMKTRTSRERKPSKFKVSPFVHNLRKMRKHQVSNV